MKIYCYCVCGIVDTAADEQDVIDFLNTPDWDAWFPLFPSPKQEYQIPMVEWDEGGPPE